MDSTPAPMTMMSWEWGYWRRRTDANINLANLDLVGDLSDSGEA